MMYFKLFCFYFVCLFEVSPVISTTVGTPKPEIFLGACPWFEKRDTNTFDGIAHSFLTITECRQACQGSANRCVFGFDWDSENPQYKCWFSTTNRQSFAKGVSHFSTTCPETTPPSFSTQQMPSTTKGVGSDCIWRMYNNTNTYQGMKISDSNTIKECQMKCLQQNKCQYGFDFVKLAVPGYRCYISNDKRLFQSPGINHHYQYCLVIPLTTPTKGGSSAGKRSFLSSEVLVFVSTIFTILSCIFLSGNFF